MAELYFQIAVSEEVDPEAAGHTIKERLNNLEQVEDSAIQPRDPRSLADVISWLGDAAALLSAGVLLVQGSRMGLAELRKLLVEIKRVIQEVNGVTGVAVKAGDSYVPIDEITDEQLLEELLRA
jgi:hypothetical protein